ncbi:hypothetical protein DUNSADRAFT_14578 [Dunaliella salina]|uniref:Encoded protein n=1 Tax=Dunaliella salina TaxID=3046 RepID=A0ABQ7G772_DUNSA|nr:hypothetical protein DUNSADRAFT_14578 [Dunaliella salina]|eukprot:KAF5830419.1 hypothetical protein DUNSADRAFT_14578 [Dunaliella salina]
MSSSLNQQQPSIHAFSGTAPELLDAMLLSIANPAKPRANPALCGRELTPYFGSAEPAVQSPPTRGPRSSAKQQQPFSSPAAGSCSSYDTISTNNSAATNNKQAAKRKHASPTSGTPTSSSPPNSSPLKSANHNRGRGGSPSASPSSGPRSNSAAAGTPSSAPQQRVAKIPNTMPSIPPTRTTPLQPRSTSKASTPSSLHNAAAKYYCPGMFSSPKPETLPIPTGLLCRALVAA